MVFAGLEMAGGAMASNTDFAGDIGLWQRKVAECPEGVARRMAVYRALGVGDGQSALDIGCGGGHLVREFGLAAGARGRAVGLDMSAAQLAAAKVYCADAPSVELVEGDATSLPFGDGTFDAVASIQTLEYVPRVEVALAEARRVLRRGGKAAFVSVLWDHWRFFGAEPELNNRVHDAWRAHCPHQMLPAEMPRLLAAAGFAGVSQESLAFYYASTHGNAFPHWAAMFTEAFVVGRGFPKDDARRWRDQLAEAAANGRFAFVSMPILTTATAI